MNRIALREAAEIMAGTYDRSNQSDVEVAVDVAGVQAVYLKSGILVIPGTNEFSDWYEFNFNLIANRGTNAHGFEVVSGDSGARWHAGFLRHAQTVYTFAKALRPRLVIGHSLGAASAQIVGSSLGVPTVAFASPRTLCGRTRIKGEGWVVNICRVDDTVCHVPPGFSGFRHVGSRYWMAPSEVDPGEDHRIDQYIELIDRPDIAQRLPQSWPR